jgi:hypothetical protein
VLTAQSTRAYDLWHRTIRLSVELVDEMWEEQEVGRSHLTSGIASMCGVKRIAGGCIAVLWLAVLGEAGAGKLTVTRWRNSNTEEVVLTLPVLGSYSAIAPYACPKSRRILEQGC